MPVQKTGKHSLMSRWRGLWPGKMDRPLARLAAWLDLLVVDLGLLRAPVNRPVEVAPGVWRSNQPTPFRLNALARKGFKTVLNLRGEGRSGAFYLEQYYAEHTGLQLISLKLSSRRPPTVAQVEQLQALFDDAPKPLLLHCKSGADRAGLVSALYLIHQGTSASEAKKQLSLRYLHIKSAATGMMDRFVESFEQAEKESGAEFSVWLHQDYDRIAMINTFNSDRKSNWLVDKVLRRE
jgi:protein tyrosine/serine phosphatase